MAESSLRILLENGKIRAKYVNRTVLGSQGRAFHWKDFLRYGASL
jgi:hypothetical protein